MGHAHQMQAIEDTVQEIIDEVCNVTGWPTTYGKSYLYMPIRRILLSKHTYGDKAPENTPEPLRVKPVYETNELPG